MLAPRTAKAFRITIALLAYGFLIYKAITFKHWEQLDLLNQAGTKLLLLISTVALTPFNLLTEAWHFRFSISKLATISILRSYKVVLGSMIPALLTPFKIGEWPGRAYFFNAEERTSISMAAAFAGIIKTITYSFWGMMAVLLLWRLPSDNTDLNKLIIPGLFMLAALFFFILGSKKIANKLLSFKFINKDQNAAFPALLNKTYAFKSFLIASTRTFIVYLQFYLMVSFFVSGEVFGLMGLYIPVYFMILTFLPAFSLLDPALRGSVAILLFAGLSTQAPMIAIAGIVLWFINNLIPVIMGSVIWLRKRDLMHPASQKQSSC